MQTLEWIQSFSELKFQFEKFWTSQISQKSSEIFQG